MSERNDTDSAGVREIIGNMLKTYAATYARNGKVDTDRYVDLILKRARDTDSAGAPPEQAALEEIAQKVADELHGVDKGRKNPALDMLKHRSMGIILCALHSARRVRPIARDTDSASGVEESVIAEIRLRRERGLSKYGVGTERTDLSLNDWLQHAKEEALDFAIYLAKAQDVLAAAPARQEEEL